ncbi:hypothetical protein LJC20_04040 [Eubacteriales bacterium OttesenSCG-928-M02]|nr:hypothetical protein [Eubacteriales bacterium OttesenSCG-928-M02]
METIDINQLLYGLWYEELFSKEDIARMMDIPNDIALGDLLGDLVAQRLIYAFYQPSPARYRISPKGKEVVTQYLRQQQKK